MPNFIKAPCDEGVMQSAPDTGSCAKHTGLWVLVATILGSSMAFIDGSVVNVALPLIQRDLNATTADMQWIVEAYTLFLAALILVGGSLGDRFGRRRIFMIGTIIFTLASIWCGLASDVIQLIIARAIEGAGGALLVPGSLAIISASFGEDQRGRAIGTWSGFTAITSVVGPVIGGGLVQYASWRWVFFINVPLAVIVLGISFWRVPESHDEDAQGRLDWRGALLTIVGLGALVYGLIQAGALGLGDPVVLATLAVGIIALALFLVVESHVPLPMVPLTLFRSFTFSGANLLTFLLYGALGGLTFFLPFNLIQVQGYTPTAAGTALVPFVLIMFTLSRWTGGLVNRYGAKLPLIVGPCITAFGFVLFAVPGVGGSYWLTFFPAVLVMGFGMTITVAPLTTTVMGAVEARHAGIASGINNAVSRTAGLLAIAVLGIVMLAAFNNSLDSHLAQLQLSPGLRHVIDMQRTKLAGITIPPGTSAGVQVALKNAIGASFVSGFRLVALICTVLALMSALCSWLMIQGKSAEHANTTPQRVSEPSP
jgi:EmrB/QacA subfamily drug resistance transporter